MASALGQEFVRFALAHEVLRFGEFRTKAGRLSPYFFDAGLFYRGAALKQLAQFYAKAILAAGLAFDLLFGPAYKGIALAAAVAIALAEAGCDVAYSFNRKEAKDHGEGGAIVGAPLRGRVLIVDDVISAGTSVHESVERIQAAGALACGVVVALDRMERGSGPRSAVQEVRDRYNIPVLSVATLDDLIAYLASDARYGAQLAALARYRELYGATPDA